MNSENIINFEALNVLIKNEVKRLVEVEVRIFKKELSANYYFEDCLMSREEVAKKLNISLGTLDNLRDRNKLHACRIGNSVKFRKSDILEYISNL